MMLEGKVAIVTGAGQGIGAATARRMAEEGASVVVSDVADEMATAVVAEIEAAGGKAVFVHCDVSEVEDVKALMAATVERVREARHPPQQRRRARDELHDDGPEPRAVRGGLGQGDRDQPAWAVDVLEVRSASTQGRGRRGDRQRRVDRWHRSATRWAAPTVRPRRA